MRFLFVLFSMLCALLLLCAPLPEYAGGLSCSASSPVSPAETEEELPVSAAPVLPASADALLLPFSAGGEMRLLPLGEILAGVLCGELPLSFPTACFQAQAIAARTYLLFRAANGDSLSGDSGVCCAYLSREDVPPEKWEKACAAAEATAGEVLLFEGAPACTVFHAMSCRRTASSAEVWGNALPYLVSVPTPEEPDTAGVQEEVRFPSAEVSRLLGIPEEALFSAVCLPEETSGRTVSLVCKTQTLSAGEVRRALGLRSADFTVSHTADGTLVFTVRGFGHGVGMSQTGAAQMAEDGADCKSILAQYYPGTVCAVLSEEAAAGFISQ